MNAAQSKLTEAFNATPKVSPNVSPVSSSISRINEAITDLEAVIQGVKDAFEPALSVGSGAVNPEQDRPPAASELDDRLMCIETRVRSACQWLAEIKSRSTIA